ncbi:MAG: YhgE/Pip domain-containing protein [Humibacillus sp.]
MNPVRLALAELRRLTANRLAAMGLVALTVIPTLYGGLYLWANNDPYAALSQVPAAVASADAGTTLATGERLHVGDQVAHDLVASRSFDWHRVGVQEALDGVEQGRYSFAVILPETFSADLASTGGRTPHQARLTLETNDANNYLTSLMGNTVIKEVTASVASEVSSTAASQLLAGFSDIHDELGRAVDGAEKLRAGAVKAGGAATQAADGARALASGVHDLASGAARLERGAADAIAGADRLRSGAVTLATGLRTLQTQTAGLPAQTRQLADGAAQVAAGNREVARVGSTVAGVSSALTKDLQSQRSSLVTELRTAGLDDGQIAVVEQRLDTIDGLAATADGKVQAASGRLVALSAGADRVASGARTLAGATPGLTDGIRSAATGAGRLSSGAVTLASGLRTLRSGAGTLADGADRASAGATSLASGVGRLTTGLDELASGAGTLHSQLVTGRDHVPDSTAAQRTAVAQTLGAPVSVDSASFSRAGSYGAGLAPLFLSLALWIGAYVLFLLVRPLSARALATSQRSLRTALGGWLAPVAVGLVQTVVLYAVVALGLGIRVAHPVIAVLFLGLVSMTFVAILHALAARLGAAGKFLGLVLMVVQLVSAGGTFPWQTLPAPLQAVHHVVPMTYAIDGLRRLMYGADLSPLGLDIGVLATFLVAALAVSTVASRRLRVWTPSRIKPELVL